MLLENRGTNGVDVQLGVVDKSSEKDAINTFLLLFLCEEEEEKEDDDDDDDALRRSSPMRCSLARTTNIEVPVGKVNSANPPMCFSIN